MMMQTIHFDDKVVVESTNTGKTIDADVLSFKENSFLSVVIQKTVKLHMQYNEAKKVYIGSQSGMECITEGPEKFVTKHGR